MLRDFRISELRILLNSVTLSIFCKNLISDASTCDRTLLVITRGRVEDTRLEAKDTKKSEAMAKDSLSEDRHSRGQGQECSRPRTKDTSASALQKKKKKGLHKKFLGDLKKKKKKKRKVFTKIFQALHKILTIQKIVLSSSRGQASFRGLDLRGQGLQNVSSRPRTSSRTPPLVITQDS